MSGSLPHAIANHNLMSSSSSGYSSFDYRTDNHTDTSSLNARNAKASSDLVVTLSEQGQALSQQDSKNKELESAKEKQAKLEGELSETEKKEVDELQKRDQEVRRHEQAHSSVGGTQTGSPSYTYKTGPDGKQYVTDGEVPITVDKNSRKSPEQTIADMNQVYRAALAPMDPSTVDRQAAAEAQTMIAKAEQQKAQEENRKLQQNNSDEIKHAKSVNPHQEAKLRAYQQGNTKAGDFFSGIV